MTYCCIKPNCPPECSGCNHAVAEPQPYELDDVDRELVAKCRQAVAYDDNGDPMKDVLDEDDFRDAVRLVVLLVDGAPAEGEVTR